MDFLEFHSLFLINIYSISSYQLTVYCGLCMTIDRFSSVSPTQHVLTTGTGNYSDRIKRIPVVLYHIFDSQYCSCYMLLRILHHIEMYCKYMLNKNQPSYILSFLLLFPNMF